MNIYIDESGSFVSTDVHGKWNAVVAVAVPPSGQDALAQALSALKHQSGVAETSEAKLGAHSEKAYLLFLENLARCGLLIFCTATDSGRNDTSSVIKHQAGQVAGLLQHLDKMRHASGRAAVELMAAELRSLSPQLYVQLTCQINLMYDVVCRTILYFAQREPAALSHFTWQVDRKNIDVTTFEKSFEKLSPPLLQSRSIEEPIPMLRGLDYSHLAKYEYEEGKIPGYLSKVYGIEVESGLNIQKIVREDIAFVDSVTSPGVQVADLIASGIRRCLRRDFRDNDAVAKALGKLMVQAQHNGPPINLVSFGEDAALPRETSQLIRLMILNARDMMRGNFIYGGKGPIEF